MARYKVARRITYPHTAIGPFFTALKQYLNKEVYNFQTNIIGTFDKAIQVIEQRRNEQALDPLNEDAAYATERYMAEEPILIITPTLKDPLPETDLPMKYLNWAPYQSVWFKTPILFPNSAMFNIVTRRIVGSCDIKVFSESTMEAHDIMMGFHDAFRGLNKWIPLTQFNQLLILNNNIRAMTEDGELVFNWEESTLSELLIPSINSTEYCLYTPTSPAVMLESITDASNFYGGTTMPSYALTGSIKFELEVPSMYVVETHAPITSIDLEIKTDYVESMPNPLVITGGVVALEFWDGSGDYIKRLAKIKEREEFEVPYSSEAGEGWVVEIVLSSINANTDTYQVYNDGLPVHSSFVEIISDTTLHVTIPRITSGTAVISVIRYEPLS